MHLLPTRGRPKGLQRFFDGGVEHPGVVILDKDDAHNYDDVRYPTGWHKIVMEKRSGYVASANAGFNAFPNEPWYMMVSDDCVGRTPHWDTLLGEEAATGKIVWPNDGGSTLEKDHCVFPVVCGDFCRYFGWFVHPTLFHMYSDTLWRDIQRVLGDGGYRNEILVEHMHFTKGKAKFDDTYRGRHHPSDRTKLMPLGGRPFRHDYEAYLKLDSRSMAEELRCLR